MATASSEKKRANEMPGIFPAPRWRNLVRNNTHVCIHVCAIIQLQDMSFEFPLVTDLPDSNLRRFLRMAIQRLLVYLNFKITRLKFPGISCQQQIYIVCRNEMRKPLEGMILEQIFVYIEGETECTI